MQETVEALCREVREKVHSAQDLNALENLRVEYLGKKGHISLLLSRIAQVPPAERPTFGKQVNEAKQEASRLIQQRHASLQNRSMRSRFRDESLDVTLPGKRVQPGRIHPVSRVMQEILEVFQRLSFSIAEGPIVETDYYNFEALNIPKDHPARDMQDTFYLKDGRLLRTHTSPVQIRVMQKAKPPLRVVSGGKVYRRDNDITHSPMFHQVEGFAVDRKITMADLKGILTLFVREIFDAKTRLRFRPSFFPFTEPSAEVDISCILCAGKGCRVCSQSGWLEILGAGMIHPRVFEAVGYPAGTWQGFAFGLGVERVAMLKYGIGDIRLFFENDQRFLRQF